MSAASKITAIGLAALSFVSLGGCESDPAPAPMATATVAPSDSTQAAPAGWRPSHTARTTSYAMAVRNLDSQIADTERKLKDEPDRLGLMAKLVGQLQTSVSRLGRLRALDRVVALGEEAVAKHPDDPKAYLLRARASGAVHRFDEALADLDHAEKLGAAPAQTRLSRATIHLGLGGYDRALALARGALEQRKTPTTLTIVAAVLGRMGKLTEAEKRFAEAERSYVGVNPFQLAWIYFEWGAMYDRAGRRDDAEARYRAAVERLPGYAHAVGHLAALVAPAEARALLEPIVASSDDPEYVANLAALKNAEEAGSGRAMMAEATEGYAALMKKHPLAFADHAGWFYLDAVGQVDAAVEVAEMNLKARKVPEAYELLVASLVAANERDEACRRADEGLARPYPTLALKSFAAKAYEACGKKDRAAELHASLPKGQPHHEH